MSAAPSLQFANYKEEQFEPPISLHFQQPERLQDVCVKKPPRAVAEGIGGLGQAVPPGDIFGSLDEAYVLENRDTVLQFIDRYHLIGILLQAIEPLREAFTQRSVKTLSLLTDEDGFETLFCLIMTPGDVEEAVQALKRFDQDWWLARSHHVSGRLNFDFELV